MPVFVPCSLVLTGSVLCRIMSSPDEQVRLLDEDSSKQQARTQPGTARIADQVEDTEYIASENELSEHNPLYESEPAVTAASLNPEPEAENEGSLKMKNVFQVCLYLS